MGFFSLISNIFSNKLSDDTIKSFIDVNIHTNDKTLIKDEDIVWIYNLSKNDIEKILQEDDIFRMGRYKILRDSGLDSNTSIINILHDFPFFYLQKEKRNKMPGNEEIWRNLKDGDMRLPFCIKNRFNKFLMNAQYDKDIENKFKYYIKNSTSANFAIRNMIKDGVL